MLFYEGQAPSLFVRPCLCFETKCLKKMKLYIYIYIKYNFSFFLDILIKYAFFQNFAKG